MKDVCILIPTLNEEATIGEIVDEFQKLGYEKILVIDGGSTDRTREIAEKKGARVVTQEGKGKGVALQQAFNLIDEEIIVLIDGDGTYLPSEVELLLKPLLDGYADHVIGNRFSSYHSGAFTRLNLIGNRILNKIFGFAYGAWLNDILSGYRAFTTKSIRNLELNKSGFEIEAEMTVESIKKEVRIAEVPITYLPRRKGVITKLSPLRDGMKIGYTIYGLAKTYNPMFYFGLLGAVFVLIGLVSGIFVILDYLYGVTRVPLAIFTALMILAGIQILIFGVFGNLIVYLQKEVLREIRKK
jgi:dolichol-phosphate mannosyltransferase